MPNPKPTYRTTTLLIQNHRNTVIASNSYQSQLEQPEVDALVSTLAALTSFAITHHVHVSADGPSGAHDRRSDREFETSKQQSSDG